MNGHFISYSEPATLPIQRFYGNFFGNQWLFEHPQWLHLIWAAPLFALFIFVLLTRVAGKQRLIADSAMISTILGERRHWNSAARSLLILLVICSLSIATARPQSDPREVEVDARGRDVVFLIDVSRSMLAEDVAPNRLEKAKLWINDLVDNLGNDRVGLVAFAGSSSVLSPLTTDRLFFKLALEELSPQSVHMGGTNIGDAIRKTMDLVLVDDSDSSLANYRDIILITDGEDQESLPIQAAGTAGADGVRIIAIGIGSDRGAVVPWDNESSTPRSQTVNSKLESGTLKAIASASPGGVYLEVGTGTIDLAQVYSDLISSAEQRSIASTSHVQYTEQFMTFIAFAVVLILIENTIIPYSNRRRVSC